MPLWWPRCSISTETELGLEAQDDDNVRKVVVEGVKKGVVTRD